MIVLIIFGLMFTAASLFMHQSEWITIMFIVMTTLLIFGYLERDK